MVTRLALWNRTECEAFAEGIRAHRDEWIPRHVELPSYTLGAAAYLDVPYIGLAAYALRARRLNKVLGATFEPAYRTLATALSDHLGSQVELTRRFGVPGFHLFLHHPRLGELVPSLHFDLQYQELRWQEAEASSRSDRFSFTALIEAPAGGAGLQLWPIRHDQTLDMSLPEVEAWSKAEAPERHDYRVGELFIHDGDYLHQIDASRDLGEGEARITLQGHAQKTQGHWVLYW